MLPTSVGAAQDAAPAARPNELQVRGPLKPLAGVENIKFNEFFRMPIGPKGLEPSPRLLALNDKRVRLIGYMVQEEEPTAGVFILTPLPVQLGDEDESLSDDLPASAVFVHLAKGVDRKPVSYLPGLIQVSGVLRVGGQEEAGGRVSAVRLELSPQLSRKLLGLPPLVHNRQPALHSLTPTSAE